VRAWSKQEIARRSISSCGPLPLWMRTIGVGRGAAERLGPVRGESLAVLRMESVAERVADNLVGHHPVMPCLSQAEQTLAAARHLIDASHLQMMSAGSPPGRPRPAPSTVTGLRRTHSPAASRLGRAGRGGRSREPRWASAPSL
jgi:hypothetical protein